MSQINPYNRLLLEIKEFCSEIQFPHRVNMWLYAKNRLNDGYSLSDLYERVYAADQLGYDVVLQATKDGLNVQYVKRHPIVPLSWRY